MANIVEIEGIGEANGTKLKEAGAGTLEKLLELGASAKGREDLSAKTGISTKMLLEWVNRADLARVNGVGSEFADLLEAAGVDSVTELAQRNSSNLALRFAELNEERKLVRRIPTPSEIEGWIEQSKTLPKVVTH